MSVDSVYTPSNYFGDKRSESISAQPGASLLRKTVLADINLLNFQGVVVIECYLVVLYYFRAQLFSWVFAAAGAPLAVCTEDQRLLKGAGERSPSRRLSGILIESVATQAFPNSLKRRSVLRWTCWVYPFRVL